MLIGQQLGAGGSPATLTIGETWQTEPAENLDRAVRSLRQLNGQEPIFETKRFEAQVLVTCVKWTCSPDLVEEAGRIVEQALWRRAPDDAIVAAFHGIRGFMVRRSDPVDFEHELIAWAKKLRTIPGDVALEAISSWPDRSKFWPSWLELRETMTPVMSARYALSAAIRQAATPRLRAAEKDDLTEEQRAAVVARFREKMASVRLKEMEAVDD